MQKVKKYFWNILISIDQFANTVFLGDPDETISSRMGKKIKEGTRGRIPLWLCKALHIVDKNHCTNSIEEEEGKDNV